MSVTELLLKMDTQKLKAPTKEVEVKRLSEAIGAKVVVTLQGIAQDKMSEIRDMATKINPETKEYEVDINELKLSVIQNGVVNPDLKNQALMDHFKAATPHELIKKIFMLPGEMDAIYNEINQLNGYGEGVIEEIKN